MIIGNMWSGSRKFLEKPLKIWYYKKMHYNILKSGGIKEHGNIDTNDAAVYGDKKAVF